MTTPALAITPLSPVGTAAVFCRLDGALWATVVVKATFQLVHGGVARLVAAEELVGADRPGARGSLERARETAPHLPNAEVLLSGHACTPGGRPAPSMSVRLGISRERPLIDKTLHAFGCRSTAARGRIGPFQKLPIVYERAFGGAGVPENPVGTGSPGTSSLPNIVDPRDARRPAGYGPIAPPWAPRRALVGALDPAALAAPVLEVPPGFDWRFFQAAPLDQQLDHLEGNEWIVLDGMSPSLPRVQSRLPQVTAQVVARVPSSSGDVAQRALTMRADMLVIDADRLIASLIWRGRFPVGSLEALASMRVLAGIEMPGEPVHWPPTIAMARTAAGKTGLSTRTQEVNVAAILGTMVPFVAASAIAPAGPSTAPTRPPKTLAGGPDTANRHPSTPMSTGTTDIDVTELLKGAMLHRGPAPAAPPPAVIAEPLAAAPIAPPCVVIAEPLTVVPIVPSAADIAEPLAVAPIAPPPVLVAEPLPAIPIASPPTTAPPSREPARPVAPARAALARRRAESLLESGEPFDDGDFAGANLSGLDLSGRSFVRCNLRGATLRGTKFVGAILTGAIVDEADLRGAVLEDADLREASFVRADLERARLGRCNGDGAILREANLLAADLRHSRFAGTSFEGAVLCDAQADGADATAARFDHADLTAASLQEACLASAGLAFARLDRADLRRATLEGANLHRASRRMARLAGADLTGVTETPPDGPSP